MTKIKLKTGPWNLSDLDDVDKHGKTVFSCFSCGGGSTMGYKLAGYDVIGCCEIDPEMMKVYRKNHNPRLHYLMGVQEFKNIPDEELPKELFELDILDGSPPCSSFSMAGSREKKWGKKSHFREGQAEQNLDDLFFDFIDIAEKIQPKVVIAENVKGLIQGNARGYVKQIFQQFRKSGYSVQLFLLNSSRMGVPQRRERTFFIANRIDKKIELKFDEKEIALIDALAGCETDSATSLPKSLLLDWEKINGGFKKRYLSTSIASKNKPCSTLTSKATEAAGGVMHWDSPRKFSNHEVKRISSFPEDYKCKNIGYLCGMSVPPFMMQRVAAQVYKQFFDESCEVVHD